MNDTDLIAVFYLIVAPIVLLIAIWIMKAYQRWKNRLKLDQRSNDTFGE